MDSFRDAFKAGMEDDLNTADGIAAIFELTRDINKALANDDLSLEFLEKAKEIFLELVTLFGFEIKQSDDDIKRAISSKVRELDPNYFVVMTVDRV